jgi:hypothetical protein
MPDSETKMAKATPLIEMFREFLNDRDSAQAKIKAAFTDLNTADADLRDFIKKTDYALSERMVAQAERLDELEADLRRLTQAVFGTERV